MTIGAEAIAEIASFLSSVAYAQEITVGGGAVNVAGTPPGEIVKNIYNFALMLGGILAFGMIVYGAVRYTLSGGNPSGQSDAKSVITDALLGLLLLLGAFTVLNLIDPNLTRLDLPVLGRLRPVREAQLFPKVSVPQPTYLPSGQCGSIDSHQACTSLSAVGCKDPASCTSHPAIELGLSCAEASAGVDITVTEATPPTVTHKSQSHNYGCAVDIKLTNYQGAKDCASVGKVVDSLGICGLGAVNEYYEYCGGQQYDTTTGENIHVYLSADKCK